MAMGAPDQAARAERLARLIQIGETFARPNADDVDKQARFPREAIDALRAERLLGVAVPEEFGGAGASLWELSDMCFQLGKHCSASAMVLAMHHIQVACLVRHGQRSLRLRELLSELAGEQRLIASVTSEVGIGGDMRSSIAAVRTNGDRFALDKEASTISYGEHADWLLVTARRTPDAPANDQALVLVTRGDYQLERTGSWDTLGMRGTCSPSFKLQSTGSTGQIVPVPFGDVASATMVPFSHVLWGSVWLGIASDALSRSGSLVRSQARKAPGTTPPSAVRLAEATTQLQVMRMTLHGFIEEYERIIAEPDSERVLSTISFALKANQLKVATSELVVRIVTQALSICGIAGYKNGGPQSLGRHLRDAYSAILMIANDRIHATNAALLLVHKGE
jgi:acyl-CoA dehydrogenase